MTAPGLSKSQLAKEKAVLWAIILDCILLVFFTIAGALSGSLTALSEIIRFLLLLTIEFVSYAVLKRTHRGGYNDFEYGTGKIERVTNLLVAFGLMLSSVYIFSKVISMGDGVPLSTNSLLLTMVAANFNLMVNYYFSVQFIRSNESEKSVIMASQISARVAKTVASVIVFLVLVLALWLPDPKAARLVDLWGSIFLVFYMLFIAYELIKESLPEILDRTVPEPEHYQILRILAEHFDRYDGFTSYKARRSGKDLFILLHLGFNGGQTLEEIEERVQPLRHAFANELPGALVTIEPELTGSG